jgi:Protein of unknown function with PCYCGC motif
LAAGVILAGCGGFEAAEHRYKLAPESVLPTDIRKAPAEVREAYRFAITNRDALRYIPCYCGCGSEGHTSNASCYVKDDSTQDKLEFDRMSLALGICIGITRDVMKMMDGGKSLKEIRAYVDKTYSKYGRAHADATRRVLVSASESIRPSDDRPGISISKSRDGFTSGRAQYNNQPRGTLPEHQEAKCNQAKDEIRR